IIDRLKWAFGVSVVTALVMPFVMGHWSWLVSLGLFLATWVFSSIVASVWRRAKTRAIAGVEGGSASLSFYGMQLAHTGIAVFIVGVTLVLGYEEQKDVRMDIGDTVQVGDYSFRFDGVQNVSGPNYDATRGHLTVFKNNKPFAIMEPEKRIYLVQQMPMTEAAIRPSLFGDLYASLGEPVSNGAWSIRVYYKPFVDWIWGGCFIMLMGGVLAISDRRYRLSKVRAAARVETQTPAGVQG
ncbi:MAG: c-type cytochrome biogenesis protein CcmF, partial [Gammaproteobacteria bacterium]|nr:c-type cytochrome biogenesis protein CcmF [Gammaproteobacteria bacterium]